MTKFNRLHRTLSSLLTAALALGSAAPSWALKQTETAQSSGLEELEERLRQVASAVGLSLPDPASTPARPEPFDSAQDRRVEGRALSAAGLEEDAELPLWTEVLWAFQQTYADFWNEHKDAIGSLLPEKLTRLDKLLPPQTGEPNPGSVLTQLGSVERFLTSIRAKTSLPPGAWDHLLDDALRAAKQAAEEADQSREQGATSAGLEEWQTVPRQNLPEGLWKDLGAYGLLLDSVSYVEVRPPDEAAEVLQPFAHPGAAIVIPMSVNQALGSTLFKGLGKGYKVIADGNAVFMGFHSLTDYTLQHPREAFLILGDEGDRDSSIALRVGSVFFGGRIIPFRDMGSLREELGKLLREGITIRGIIGDGLENTNDFVEGKPDSWGVVAVVDMSQSLQDLERLTLIPDHLRRAGWLYHAPRPAEGLSPFDLPAAGFRKIAQANGVDPNDADALASWMAGQRQVTLLKRPFLEPARSQGSAFSRDYPGFQSFYPSDGDLFPAILAAMGLDVDGHRIVTVTRHGANEGFIAAVAANNVRDAHFVHTFVSVQNTEKASSLTAETGHNFGPEERALEAGFGVESDRLTAIDTKESWPHQGVIAVSSVTGASQQLAGQWARFLKEVEFRQDPQGLGGQVTVHTFVLARDGSAYVVRTLFKTKDLPEAQEWIKLASRLPSPVPPPVQKPAPETQLLKDLSSVVSQDNLSAVLGDPQREVSQTFRYVLPDHLAQALQKLEIGYHLTFLHPGRIGTGASAEFHRTRGHFHSKLVGELVEVYDGRGKILLWRTSSPEDPAIAADAILLSVQGGDKFFVPPGWAHLTLNEDPDQVLVFGTWLRQDVRLQYDAVNSLRGGPWYVGPEGSEPNPNYAHVPPYQSKVPNRDYLEKSLGIPPDRSIWSVALTDPARFSSIMEHVTEESDPALLAEQLFGAAAGLEEWGPGPNFRLYLRHAESQNARAVIHQFTPRGDQLWMTLLAWRDAAKARVGFVLTDSKENRISQADSVVHRVSVLQRIILDAEAADKLPKGTWDEIWLPGKGRLNFKNPKTVQALKSAAVLQALANKKEDILLKERQATSGLLVLTLELNKESAVAFHTIGDDPSLWHPFAEIVVIRRERTNTRFLFSSLLGVVIDRERIFRSRQKPPAEPTAGLPAGQAGLEEGIHLGVADRFMAGDILVDSGTGKRRFVVTADQKSAVDSVSIQEIDGSGKRVGEPKAIPAQIDFKLRFHAIRELVNTFNRHETHPDVALRPVTLAPPPGGVLLLQWAPQVPTEENSQFALVRIPEADGRSAGIHVLDQPGKQFQPEQFTAADSQGLNGMQVPYRVRVTAPWETAGKKGKEVAVASPESVALQWNPANGSLEAQNLPAGYVLLAHRLDISPEAAAALVAAGVEESVAVREARAAVDSIQQKIRSAEARQDDTLLPDLQTRLLVANGRLGAAIAAQAASQRAVPSAPAVNSDYFGPGSEAPAVSPPVVPTANPPRTRGDPTDGAWDYSFRAAGLEEGLRQAQRNFSSEPRFFQPLPVDAKPRSAVVVNLAKDERLANLAWALAIMQVKQPGNSPLFRVVVEEKEVKTLLRKWVALDRQALQRLTQLLVVRKSGERNDDAVRRAIAELEREGVLGSTQVRVQEIDELTLDLAETLRVFFTTGGLNFLTDPDAFAPFKALLEAA